MTHPLLKTLSFAFVAFSAASASAAGQGPMLRLAAMPASLNASCTAQVEIERGWEAQQRLLDERLAARGLAVSIPGTIMSPPLPDFGAARKDATATTARPAGRAKATSSSSGRS